MADEIVLVYAFLDALAANAAASAAALEGDSALMDLEFTGTPEVTSAYRSFLGKWDKHRNTLRDGIAAAGEAFVVTRDSFQTCETQLIAALQGE